ncbi:MAG TPA: hypothetical protein VJH88_03190 [Candidatus Nanoarchaeia archaeon]|nr:hypothetical protein [Candidatus Nanoarchaeia archaeon]
MNKLIRNVEGWDEFRAEAARHRLPLGKFLAHLVHKHATDDVREQRKILLSGKKRISDEDAEAVKRSIEAFEKEFDFE